MVEAVRLHNRRGRSASGSMLLEGPHLVESAVAAGVPLRVVFALTDDDVGGRLSAAAGLPPTLVTRRVLARLGTTTTPQSPIAVGLIPDSGPRPGGRVLAAWEVSDPGNLGALIRVSAAFGYGFLAGPRSTDLWSPKVLRAAAGAHFATPVGTARTMSDLRLGGRTVVAAVASGGGEPGVLPSDAALVIGSEAHGLPQDIVSASDGRVTVPVRGVESLNAAAAGAILAYLGAGGPRTNLPPDDL